MLQIKKLLFNFNDPIHLFYNLDLQIKRDEIVTILGKSGSGKSTLLNLISGLIKPIEGQIVLKGNLSYLTQTITLLPYQNAIENSLLACELRNAIDEKKEIEASNLFQLFNLDDASKKKFPDELSGGMKQRIGLIQNLIVDADLYLLDEPFNAIDKTTTLTIQEYMWLSFKEKSRSAVIVTHDLEHAIILSDKIAILDNKVLKVVCFEDEFIKLSPKQRLTSEYYNKYLIEIFKKLNEIK